MNNSDSINPNSVLGLEWTTLQDNYEQYERNALLVKLLAVGLCVVGWCFAMYAIAAVMVAVLWVQEAIFKTYQSRLVVRLLRIEGLIRLSSTPGVPFQLYTEWLASRKGVVGLVAEYASNMIKPTVVFP